MEKGILIRDINPYMEVAGIFIIVNPALLQSKNGMYWRFNISDATGSLEAKIWPPKSMEYQELVGSQPVYAAGKSTIYHDQVQINVEYLRYLTDEEKMEVDQTDFLPHSGREIDDIMREFKELCLKEFQHPAWRRLFTSVIEDPWIENNLKTCPAARNIHHAWLGGLLEHTLGVAKICLILADLYPEIDRQTLLAGAIFHDLGKLREFSSNFSIEYTDEGSLQGHSYLGLELLAPFIEKSQLEPYLAEHLKHLILSHHGQPEYGAAKLPQTKEAFILHFADNIDARLIQCRSIFTNENISPGSWSNWQKSLDRKLLNARPTPVAVIVPDAEKTFQEEICLSLLKE